MKPAAPSIPIFTISDINAAAGRTSSDNQFHVTKSTELVLDEKFIRPVRSDSNAFILATKGTAKIKYNLIDYSLTPGSLFIIAPDIIHEVNTPKGELIALGFSQEFFARSMVHKKHIDAFTFLSSQSDPHLQLNPEEADHLVTLMMTLRKTYAYDDHPFKEDLMFHGFNLFMLEVAALFKKHRYVETIQLTRREEMMMQFLKLLSIHFREERSVQYYAAQMFVTPKHLTKTVKELTGKTCGAFIDEMVIAEAKILLDDTSNSIGNVADQLHFSDQFFFSKFFKNATGLSPSQYKSTAM